MPDPLKIFLCHATEDKPKVRDLYDKLKADGFEPWLDEVDLLPGQDWKLEITKAVRSAAAVLVCLSKTSVSKRGYLKKEIKLALDVADEQPEGAIYVIPVRLEDCQAPERLKSYQWVDLFVAGGYDKLVRSLRGIATEASAEGAQLRAPTAQVIPGDAEAQFDSWSRERLTRLLDDPKLDRGPIIAVHSTALGRDSAVSFGDDKDRSELFKLGILCPGSWSDKMSYDGLLVVPGRGEPPVRYYQMWYRARQTEVVYVWDDEKDLRLLAFENYINDFVEQALRGHEIMSSRPPLRFTVSLSRAKGGRWTLPPDRYSPEMDPIDPFHSP